MLETLVASILNRVLGSYVENFDPKYLNIGLLSGDVTLGNLKLKRGVLDQLHLPIDVTEGHIGSLVLQIPYSNFKSKPVKILIEDVFLLAAPDLHADDVGSLRRQQQVKRDKLDAWEIAERAQEAAHVAAANANAETEAQQQNFTSSLITKIVDNLQITIKNIHLRYADEDIALGATLGELSAVSTTADWEPAFISVPGATTHKLATLDSLAFYVDPTPGPEFSSGTSRDKLLQEFRQAIGDSIGQHDLLRPINGQGFITLNKAPESTSVPRAQAELKFEELALAIDRDQYVNLLGLATKFQKYARTKGTRQLRPVASVHDAPLAWFRYAAETVLSEIQEKNKIWTWAALKQRIADMKAYVELYKKREAAGATTSAMAAGDKKEFERIEDTYTFDDLVLWRSAAKRLILTEQLVAPSSQAQKKSWSQWLWGPGAAGNATNSSADEDGLDSGLTPQQRDELLSVLDISDTPAAEIAAAQLLLEVEFSLQNAGVKLTNAGNAVSSVGLGGVRLRLEKRPDNFLLSSSVAEMSISDLSPHAGLREIISVRQAGAKPAKPDADSPFFWFLFEHHPLDREVDSRLFVKSKSLMIVHSARFIEDIVAFFAAPPDQGETVDAILNAANKTVEELREQTRIGLEYALQNHKTLDLQLDVQAPIIVIPLDPRATDSAATVLDVGSLTMTSDIAPHEVVETVKSKQAQRYTDSDWKRLESLMYDRFKISLKDTQVLLGDSMRDLRTCMGVASSRLHFLDKTTLDFLLEVSIVPNTKSLPRARVSIKLPALKASLSDVQYKLFMSTLEAAVPVLGVENDQSSLDSSSDDDVPATKVPTPPQRSPSPTSDGPVAAQQQLVVNFAVDKVQLTLERGWDAKELLELALHGFHLSYIQTTNGEDTTNLHLTIAGLDVTDFTNAGGPPELCKLAQSQNTGGDDHMFEVMFRKKPDGSRQCDVVMDAIDFVLNPTTVLTVYDYIMTTFAPPEGDSAAKPQSLRRKSSTKSLLSIKSLEVEAESAPMAVTVTLKGITALLNENNHVLAKIELASAKMNVVLQDALKFQCLLGPLSVTNADDGQHILSIQGGGDLADFRYETPPGPPNSAPSLVYFRSGALLLNVVTKPLARMAAFFARFAVMKSVYDQSRLLAFNQAIQLEPTNFLFDIVVSSPIVRFETANGDWLEAHLGEIYVKNKFAKNGENNAEAGIRGVHLHGSVQGVKEAILGDTDFSVTISHDASGALNRPVLVTHAGLSAVKAELCEWHYRLVMEFIRALQDISQSVGGPGETEIGDLRRQLAKEKQLAPQQTNFWALTPASLPKSESGRDHVDFSFEAPLLSLSLRLNHKPLSSLKLDGVEVRVHVNAEGTLLAHGHVRSLSVEDTRSLETNKFPQIVPPAKHEGYQVMAKLTLAPGDAPDLQVSVDSPQVLVALDYLSAIQVFLSHGEPTLEASAEKSGSDSDESDAESESGSRSEPDRSEPESGVFDESDDDRPAVPSRPPQLPMRPSTREIEPLETEETVAPASRPRTRVNFNAVELFVTILADSSDANTEAVVFKIEQLVAKLGETSSLEVSRVSMYLTQMQAFDSNKLRILDDFSISGTADDSDCSDLRRLTSLKLHVQPLVLRLSLREVLLISRIFQQALSLKNPATEPAKKPTSSTRYTEDGRRDAATQPPSTALVPHESNTVEVLGEHGSLEFDGFRLVIIDPAHQVPMADFVVKPFAIEVRNWTAGLLADLSAEMYASVYSFSKSAWEPLVDTLSLGVSVRPGTFEVFTKNVTDVEVTPEILELARDVQDYFSNAGNTFSLDRHEDGHPYRIRNDTGLPIDVWSAISTDLGGQHHALKPDEEIKFSFFHWRQARENLNASVQDVAIGVSIPGFDPLEHVSVNRVGEHLYSLTAEQAGTEGPGGSKIRLVVEIVVKKHLKYIHLRSTEQIVNDTATDMEVLLTPARYADANHEHTSISLPAGKTVAVPLLRIDSRLLLRPKGADHWSTNSIYWRDLLANEGLVNCRVDNKDWWIRVLPEVPEAPLAQHYPYQSIHLTPPFQLVNNLPVAMHAHVYCKDTRRDTQYQLDAGARYELHDVNTQELLLLSVHPDGYDRSECAVVSMGHMRRRDFDLEEYLDTYSAAPEAGGSSSTRQKLTLRIQYVDMTHGRGRVLVVYAPYVIMNKTGQELLVTTRLNRAVLSPSALTMWSFESRTGSGQRATLRVPAPADGGPPSHWSPPVSFDSVGSALETALPSRDRSTELFLGVQPLQGSGRYATTKTVTIMPRFMLNNRLARPLEFREPGGQHTQRLEPGDCAAVGFISSMCDREMCLRLADSDNAMWSSSFVMANIGTTHVRIQEKGKPTLLAKVDVILEGSTLFANIQPSTEWPFAIRNFTDTDFYFYQSNPYIDADSDDDEEPRKKFSPIMYHLPAKSAMPYSWDFPAARVREVVLESNGKRRKIQLQEIGELPPAKFGPGNVVDLNVVADGPQQALVVTTHDPEASMYALTTAASRTTTTGSVHIKQDAIDDSNAGARTFKLILNGIGISYTTDKQELMYVTFRHVRVNYQVSDALETLAWQVEWIQVDNCLSGSTEYPVMVYPSVVSTNADEIKRHPTFSGSITRVRDESYGLTYIKHATVLLQEMTIETDEDFIVSAMEMMHVGEVEGWHFDGELFSESMNVKNKIVPRKPTNEDFYFEQLHLQPMQLNLSFMRTGALTSSGYFGELHGSSAYVLDALTMTIGNINDAPVRFNALLAENVRAQVQTLIDTVRTHYEQELLYQLHKIIGSADVFGNPVGLFNNISSGVADLFYEPYLGYTLTDRPQEFGVGLAKGGLSFMKKSVFGVSDSVAKVTGSLSKGLAAITMDPHFQKQQFSRHTRNRPRHAVYGIMNGAESFYDSVTSGFAGLASAPLQGAATGGTSGFFRGLGRGLVGLPTKTAIGVLDFASSFSEGVRNSTTLFDENAVTRVRLPRVVAYDGLVRPYNTREAVGQMLLHTVNEGAYIKDRYLAHSNITNDKVVIVSLEHVLVATLQGMRQDWAVTYDQLAKVVMEASGLSLELKGGTRGPFIPLPDADTRQYIYKNIGVAVAEYNRARTTLF